MTPGYPCGGPTPVGKPLPRGRSRKASKPTPALPWPRPTGLRRGADPVPHRPAANRLRAARRVHMAQVAAEAPSRGELRGLFATVAHAFELEGQTAFMQDYRQADLTNELSIGALLIEIPGQQAVEQNTDHLSSAGRWANFARLARRLHCSPYKPMHPRGDGVTAQVCAAGDRSPHWSWARPYGRPPGSTSWIAPTIWGMAWKRTAKGIVFLGWLPRVPARPSPRQESPLPWMSTLTSSSGPCPDVSGCSPRNFRNPPHAPFAAPSSSEVIGVLSPAISGSTTRGSSIP